MKTKLFLCAALAAAAGITYAPACTTTVTTKGASADGSVMISHSDDGHVEADSSIVYVPRTPIDPEGARLIYPSAVAFDNMPEYNAFLTPRIQKDDGPEAYRHPELPRTTPIGKVPYADILKFLGDESRQTTYAYLDGSYGINNEWGLMFGECTNGSKATVPPIPGKRIFYTSELSRLALEHCKTARDAVRFIGHLIDTYGYWGTGETIPVGDADEAWVIEIAPVPADYDKAGGLWVAQKVPDGEFFIAANEFRIREVDPAKRGDAIMYGDALFETARNLGWWTESDTQDGLMDWLPTVSLGEYSHPYYSLRRVWRGLSLAAPSLNLKPWIEDGNQRGLTRRYPFSVKPDKKLSAADIRSLHRDHYQGTEFDLTRGVAAGPWGNPNRYLGTNDPGGDVGDPNSELTGAWERPIGVYYTNIAYVNQAWAGRPYPLNTVSWIALSAPSESVFVPFAVAPLPSIYETMDAKVFNIDGQAWRLYDIVAEYVNIKYCYMIKDINAAQIKNETGGGALLESLQTVLAPAASKYPEETLKIFSGQLNDAALKIHGNWRKLFEQLVVNYNQGEVNRAAPGETPEYGRARYPDTWLEATDYYRGPTVYKKKTGDE
jgi:dipeptidase